MFEHGAVGGCGGVGFGGDIVEDDAGAFEAAGVDGLDGEEGVAEGAEAVCGDDEDGEGHFGGHVGDGIIAKDGGEPAADALDDDGAALGADAGEAVADLVEVGEAVFDDRCGVRGGGKAEPDRVDVIEGEFVVRGGVQGLGVGALAAADGLEADGVEAGGAEGADEEDRDVGFAYAGVGACQEVVQEVLRGRRFPGIWLRPDGRLGRLSGWRRGLRLINGFFARCRSSGGLCGLCR